MPARTEPTRAMRLAFNAGLAATAAAAAGLVFALWAENGSRMFLALAQSGLSWCF